MKIEELLEKIARNYLGIKKPRSPYEGLGHTNFSPTVKKFLCGRGNLDKGVSSETQALIKKLNLQGDDYEYVGEGENNVVIGNAHAVLKIEYDGKSQQQQGFSVGVDEIPEDLACRIIDKGTCNGIRYMLCERLNSPYRVTIEEVIPFLFAARDRGFVYWNPKPENFSYNSNGELQVIDHEHFARTDNPKAPFEAALASAINCMQPSFPCIAFDDKNTYVILGGANAAESEPGDNLQQKKMLASLAAVGISQQHIEIVDAKDDCLDPTDVHTVIRIRKTQVSYGTPPETHELADYIDESLKTGASRLPERNPGQNVDEDRRKGRNE